jgi:hypothetical protein
MRSMLAVTVCAFACAWVCACAKAPDASTNAKAGAEVNAPASLDAGLTVDAGGRVPGLPMPQQFLHFVWDAAAADAASGHGR